MAELHAAREEFLLRARALVDLLRTADVAWSPYGSEYTLTFADPAGADALRLMLANLKEEDAALTCLMAEEEHQPAADLLEAPPTKPLNVEIRQWALALMLQHCDLPENDEQLLKLLNAADVFCGYAWHGIQSRGPVDPA